MLEEIRFPLNVKLDSESPMGLILAGQTELWQKLQLQAYAAVDAIYHYSSGTARIIDKVCTSLLLYGSQPRKRIIDDHAVKYVLECEFSVLAFIAFLLALFLSKKPYDYSKKLGAEVQNN